MTRRSPSASGPRCGSAGDIAAPPLTTATREAAWTEVPTSPAVTGRSVSSRPESPSTLSRLAITSPTAQPIAVRPSRRPAASADTITWSAPLCRSSDSFSASRIVATMTAPGLTCRAVSAISTAVSSRGTAITIRLALAASALASTRLLVASPATPVSPARLASRTAGPNVSTTTIDLAARPLSRRVLTALRPLVPNPATIV
jgi:hypothetical protein